GLGPGLGEALKVVVGEALIVDAVVGGVGDGGNGPGVGVVVDRVAGLARDAFAGGSGAVQAAGAVVGLEGLPDTFVFGTVFDELGLVGGGVVDISDVSGVGAGDGGRHPSGALQVVVGVDE